MDITTEDYTPVRGSAKTEQARLLGVIKELKNKLEGVQRHSEIAVDPNYARSAHRYQQDLNVAFEKLERFNQKQKELEAYAVSAETQNAQTKVAQTAIAFETALEAVAVAANALVEDAADLASSLHLTEQGIFPSSMSVNDAIKSRVIKTLGDLSPIKFTGYGDLGKASQSLAVRFKA